MEPSPEVFTPGVRHTIVSAPAEPESDVEEEERLVAPEPKKRPVPTKKVASPVNTRNTVPENPVPTSSTPEDPTPEDPVGSSIKVVNLLVPYARGGKVGLFGGARVGKTVLAQELNNVAKTHGGFSISCGMLP